MEVAHPDGGYLVGVSGCLETTWSPDVGYSDPFVAVTVENPREVPPSRTQPRLSTIIDHQLPQDTLPVPGPVRT